MHSWQNVTIPKKDEAFTVADQAIQRGKADKVDTSSFEKRLADLKAGKM